MQKVIAKIQALLRLKIQSIILNTLVKFCKSYDFQYTAKYLLPQRRKG